MSITQAAQYEETRTLVRSLNHHLIRLTTSLKGRLSSSEEDILAELFQVQINLETLLDEIQANSDQAPSPAYSSADAQNSERIVYAQAMQYARDLVKAMRQKKEHQHRLELTSQQLIRAEKLATVGQIAAAVAHELGNIFTPLLMYAKLIYEETVDQENSDAAEFAVQITQIANRATHMLRQLVDASRRESTMVIPVDLPHTIQNALTLLFPQFKDSNIQIEQYYPDEVPLVMGRPDQLEQVFINIARNAFDAMPEGGNFTVTVETGNEKEPPSGEADFVSIRLSDTGEGIPPENIGSLFEPFFTTKARGAGSGLGLFVSYLIINQHGGTIEVESEPGAGTTFTLKLPAADKEEDEN